MLAADPRSLRLSEMSQCAYRLGLAFGAEAERAETPEQRLEYFHLFDRCFFAVRVATALELRLWRAPAARAQDAETERAEPLERDGAERADREAEGDREREREVEPASLPVLMRTLNGVAADASALPGPELAALPTLRELLARVISEPTPAAEPRNAGGALRSRLAGSATAQTLTLPQPARPGPLRPTLRAGPVRRATGPPFR